MERNIGRENAAAGAVQTAASAVRRAANPDMITKVKRVAAICLSHWWWFLLALTITMGYAVLKIKKTIPVYSRTVSIMLKPDDKSGEMSALSDLGLNKVSTNITNEILALKSGTVSSEVVRRLNLDVEYFKDGAFHKNVIYGVQLPLTVSFIDLNDSESASFDMYLNGDSDIVLSRIHRNGHHFDGQTVTAHLHDTVLTPAGRVAFLPTLSYRSGDECRLEVVRTDRNKMTASVQNRVSAYLRDKNASIIDISFRDASVARAEDVLNTLISVYNENWVRERNQKTINTNNFIKERLAYIEQELSDVEQDIADWKSQNLILDISAVGNRAESEATGAENELRELENSVHMTRYLRNYLTDRQHDNQLLPANLGATNPSVVSLISEYNSLLLQRNNHLANSSLQNPLVRDIDEQLSSLRNSILQVLDYDMLLLQARQNNAQSVRKKAVEKVVMNPQQTLHLLSVERQQKVKEQLYLFLLQKREENELSQTFAAYNSQLIEPPHGSNTPIEPVSKVILLTALILGLAVPGSILALRELLNTRVRSREDIEPFHVPFVGEIPLAAGRKILWSHMKRQPVEEPARVLVEDKNRNIINEAFRVVRTNMEFMLGFDETHKIVMFSSINPGSGKTFISANMAAALGIKNKKVLAIDLDLRKGSLSEYVGSPHRGVSNYLSGQEPDYKKLIVKLGGVDYLPCGKIPPNPTELLFSPRFKSMMEELRSAYDYVLVDCPPVEIVADAAIINRYADLTLFVIRAGLMERAFLPDIEQWYEEKRYVNLSIILNGTIDNGSHYGYHKYGYHYGKYGYGYGKTSED